MKHGCTITPQSLNKRVWSGGNKENLDQWKPSRVCRLARFCLPFFFWPAWIAISRFFFDQRGLLYLDFLHGCRTINPTYFCDVLNEVPTHMSQPKTWPIDLLYDNARPHTAALTRKKLKQLGWETLEHPLNSPDLSPCDFHVFGLLKEALGGQRFDSVAEVEAYVRNWLQTRSTSFYVEGIWKLPIRREKCVSKSRDYVEK